MQKNAIIADVVSILDLCDKMLVSESDINKLRQNLGNVSLHVLYEFISNLPLNTTKVKEVIYKMKLAQPQKAPEIKKTSNILTLKVNPEQLRRKQQLDKLLNSKIPMHVSHKTTSSTK
jgi:hypothetical protein